MAFQHVKPLHVVLRRKLCGHRWPWHLRSCVVKLTGHKFKVLLYYRAKEYELQYLDVKEQLLLLEKDYQNILPNLVSINSVQGFTVLQGQGVWATVPGCQGAAPIVREELPEHPPQSSVH